MKRHVLYKTTLFHPLFIKKKRVVNGAILMALFAIFFPWTRKGRELSSPLLQRLSLPPTSPKILKQSIPPHGLPL
jgi:hypothetical protein